LVEIIASEAFQMAFIDCETFKFRIMIQKGDLADEYKHLTSYGERAQHLIEENNSIELEKYKARIMQRSPEKAESNRI
jgi:hypothetical protein